MAKTLLFVCIGNACRSQIAEGFARALGGNSVKAFSAGSRPAGFVALKAIEVMAEKGIDISGQSSKGLSDLPNQEFDAIVTMGCGDACPSLPAKHRLDWQIPDPIGKPIEFFREVRDQIEAEVKSLITSLS